MKRTIALGNLLRTLIISLIVVLVMLIVGCTIGINFGNGANFIEPDYHNLRVVSPAGYAYDTDVRDMVTFAQEYLDNNRVRIGNEDINFIFLEGMYSHEDRSTRFAGVFVNSTHEDITSFSGKVLLDLSAFLGRGIGGEIEVDFSTYSIDEFGPGDALMVVLDAPTTNATEDAIIRSDDVFVAFTNIIYTTR